MLESLMGGIFDKEKMIYTKVQDKLVEMAAELDKPVRDVFFIIRPKDEEGNHDYYICGYDEKGNPKPLKKITINEIIG
jgi:hypothetical protein